MNHISDQASTVIFRTNDTAFTENLNNVQLALGQIGAWALKPYTGSIGLGLPDATATIKGIARLATQAEATAGTSNTTIITPATLAGVVRKPEASELVFGMTRYSTDVESKDVNNNVTSITPKRLYYVFENMIATESRAGGGKVATKLQAETGVDDTVLMTPLKVKNAVDKLVASSGDATETSRGVVILATVAQTQAGTGREGMAISPYTFARAIGTNTVAGTFKLANDAEMMTLTSNQHAITPWVLGRNKASTSKFGVVKLVNSKSVVTNAALSANAEVVSTFGDTMTGNLDFALKEIGLTWTDASLRYSQSRNQMLFRSKDSFVWGTGSSNDKMKLDTTGLEVLKDVTAFGTVRNASDIRVKTDIVNVADALYKVKQLNGVTYKRTDLEGDDRHMGVIAQEVELVAPELIRVIEKVGIKDFRTVNYNGLIGLLIEAIKELSDKIDNKG